MNNTVHNRIFRIARREVFRIATRPLYLFCMIIAPLFCYLFFTTLMWNGLPTDMPAGVVDLDNTATTRSIIRNLDAFQQTKIIAHYPSFADARKAMQQGKIYAFYYIPKGTTEKALASRQPKVSFYTNYSYLVAGSLLYKDQRTMSELAGGAIGRATLYAKGATEDQAMAFLQPIVIDSHVLNNPWLNYSVYLSNTIIPGILMLLIFVIISQKNRTFHLLKSRSRHAGRDQLLQINGTFGTIAAIPIFTNLTIGIIVSHPKIASKVEPCNL